MSTYGMLLTGLERYLAVVYPIWYNNNVRRTVTFYVVFHANLVPEKRRRKSNEVVGSISF